MLPEDAVVFADPKFKDEGYRFDALPDPFVGGLNTENVIFLSLNPGFEDDDIRVNLQKPFFIAEGRKNLLHQSEVPFLYLDERMNDTHGYRWWHKLLDKSLREEPLDINIVRRHIAIVEYMPYHSKIYTHNRLIIPSQLYAFELVRQAMSKNKIIVIMRRGKVRDWIKAIPELADYPYITFNSQRPYITRSNMTKYNSPEIIDNLLRTLKS